MARVKNMFFNLFALLGLVNARQAFPGIILDRASEILQSYDYVVVGGGLSGLVVANRLSEDSGTTVLIIEAGGFTENEDWVTIPLITSSNDPAVGHGPIGSKYDWNMTSIPQPELGNRSVNTPAGKVIGGGTVLNGMVFNRGSRADYDRWEALGNPGWNFENLLPYFKKSEIFTPPDLKLEAEGWDIQYNPAYHGEHGHVHSSFAPFVWPSTRNYINAMKELEVPIINDAMGGDATGAYWFTQSVNPENETRSTSQGFYDPSRPNLHLLIGNRVTKAIIESGKVECIEFSAGENATTSSVKVLKEAILSAGALHTPQILLLSGIGETAHLSSLGIETVVDLPGVGANYHDHLLLFIGQTVNVSPNVANFSNQTWTSEQFSLYESEREGPFTTLGGNFFAFLPAGTFSNATALSSAATAQQASHYLSPNTPPTVRAGYEAQFALLTSDISSSTVAYMEFIFGDNTILPALHQPFSRGTVSINSTSPFDNPVIDPRYLSNPLDLALFVAGFEYARKIRGTAAMQEINVTETYPGASVMTSEQIEEFVRGGVSTEHHHSGTASMLPQELGGVVDSKLRLYGVEGLRIVDASIVPMVPAAHLQATLYGIAEKAADLIKSSH
ncbi:alcohol oxidase [Mollisia scopiformis]|uniref:Alcohol oxidase n=1 Tax=Mollisia scopiformis TaxID=149040 RepID=A0A132BBR7_MOLSC|nr:alcohol oxidase [Mollisia scopiformis]KUJ09818.1 alcohol oxidase [Mollisia scopiformis]